MRWVSVQFQTTAYGSVTYDPATTTAYGFQLDQNPGYQLDFNNGYQLDYNNVGFDYNNYNNSFDYSLVTEERRLSETCVNYAFISS